MRSARAVRRKAVSRSRVPSASVTMPVTPVRPRGLRCCEPPREATESGAPKRLHDGRAGERREMPVGDPDQAPLRYRRGADRDGRARIPARRDARSGRAKRRRARCRALSAVRASRCLSRRSRTDWRSIVRCGSRSICAAALPSGGRGSGGFTGSNGGARGRAPAPMMTQRSAGASFASRPAALTKASSRCSQRDGTVGTPSTLSARVR